MPKTTRAAVYMAECEDLAGNLYAKIGKAVNPLRRLPGLQVGCPFEFQRVRFVFVPTERLAQISERKVHAALKPYSVRGEWFLAKAGDDAARLALDCFPEVVAGAAQCKVTTQTLDSRAYDRVRKHYENLFGRSRPGRLTTQAS